ncbi:MAG: NAD(P)H-dependent oxidoreductase [Saprospiraceae bacterium]|nr:NAD(P)H-dependent oxidoreductase [Saprospiraceae bacterium]
MITVISGTNRPDSKTKLIALACLKYLRANSEDEIKFVDLVDINIPLLTDMMYKSDGQHPVITEIQDTKLIPSEHWLIISPEYNGSFPGALKLFIDAVSVNKYEASFSGKKVSLIGSASGRAGNFRGMEHLTGLLNYLNMVVMPNKLPISSIESQIDKTGVINEATYKALYKFLDEMLAFNKSFSKV